MKKETLELKDRFKESHSIILEKLFNEDEPVSCLLMNVFGDEDDDSHNCLGCNFADSSYMIERYLSRYEHYDNVHADVFNYILLLYLVIEQVEVVFKIINLPDAYKEKHFKDFQKIRKWANFIKHPKAFIFTHHAEYNFQDNKESYNLMDYTIIDHQFINDYYTGIHDSEKQKRKNKELFNKLSNADNVIVLLPNIEQLTKQFCYGFNKFLDVIANNEVYQEILNDKTTLENYFTEIQNT